MNKESFKALVDISNNKTKEFNTECERAKITQIELINKAWTKIEEYLLSIRDIGFCGIVEIPNLHLYWLNKNDNSRTVNTSFVFNNNEIRITERSYASDMNIIIGNKFSCEGADFSYCVKQMVTKWDKIKPKLEEVLQQTLTERMNKAEKERDDVETMNEKLASFEI